MPNEPQHTEEQAFSQLHHGHVGPILGVLVIVLILILGGLYLWGSTLDKGENQARVERTIPNNEPETARANADQLILETTSSSNDLDAIYADIESTNLDSLDAELDQVTVEMEAALR